MVASIVLLVLVILFSYSLLRKKVHNIKKSKHVPEPAGAWPIIGHLRLLGGTNLLLYRTFGELADKYGPAFGIRLGMRRAFVVSSLEGAQECFTVNDRAFTSRPTGAATKHMCYNNSMLGFVPYGDYWRELRKIITLGLLSNNRIEKLRRIWEPEISTSINELYSLSGGDRGGQVPVNLTQWFRHLTFNIIVKIVAGKRCHGSTAGSDDDDDRMQHFQKAITRFFHLMGTTVLSDAIPFLWWLDFLGHEKAMKETAKDLDSVLSLWLEEHRARRASCELRAAGTEQDFLNDMISLQEEGQFSKFPYNADTCIKSTCQSVILGGSDTIAVLMTWAVSLLLNNRHIIKKEQQELDEVVGPDRAVNESDINNLPYLQSIIKETFRLYPPAPLLQREALKDCTVGGYHISAGTQLLVNNWKIHRDPKLWVNPVEFLPERFLVDHAHVDFRGQHLEFIPFGLGRMSCPGTSFSLQVIHLTLARLLHGFELLTPTNQPVDMTESPGLTMTKSIPLEVLVTPRLRPEIYCELHGR